MAQMSSVQKNVLYQCFEYIRSKIISNLAVDLGPVLVDLLVWEQNCESLSEGNLKPTVLKSNVMVPNFEPDYSNCSHSFRSIFET